MCLVSKRVYLQTHSSEQSSQARVGRAYVMRCIAPPRQLCKGRYTRGSSGRPKLAIVYASVVRLARPAGHLSGGQVASREICPPSAIKHNCKVSPFPVPQLARRATLNPLRPLLLFLKTLPMFIVSSPCKEPIGQTNKALPVYLHAT